MKNRSSVNIFRCLFLLGAMAFFSGCDPTTATKANHESRTKKGSMNLAYKTESPAIPPIDAAVPSKFETASFGLG
jgi:hypothetical protein